MNNGLFKNTYRAIFNTPWMLSEHKSIDKDISPQLDTARGWSAILVLIAHAQQVFIAPLYQSLHPVFLLLAQASVMVFFVLSGFLICKSVTRNNRDNGQFATSIYATDRANRVLPPFLFALAILFLLNIAAPFVFPSGTNEFLNAGKFMASTGFIVEPENMIGTLLFVNGFLTENITAGYPFWSLSFEVWYYFALALMVSIKGIRGFLITLIFMISMGLLNKSFLFSSIVWFAGVAIAILHNKNAINAKLFTSVSLAAGATAISFAIFFFNSHIGIASPDQADWKMMSGWKVSSGIFFASILGLLLIKKISIPTLYPSSSGFSYTLYVIHFPVLLFIYGCIQTHILASIEASVIAAITSTLSCLILSSLIAKSVESMRPFKNNIKQIA
ncbi:acyltransferase [Pseudomonas sp. SBB6]|uniref:acyltransferase family protein n=1 Tax=Pseudomonas sp. SBB6 TaxID=2962032 RepID=UPI0020B79C52|nr:acyltransferase family protein [Pseudomonas sp. SBB6]MCP3750804.1 acyltransferase family protein [Pseudomonas sp. SBB6]